MLTCIACTSMADDQLFQGPDDEPDDNKHYYCHQHFSDQVHLMTNKPRVIYVSDLHLEFYKKLKDLLNYLKFNEWPSADILILAGDIINIVTDNELLKKRFEKMIRLFKAKYKYVIYVPGNHEYYGCKKAKISINDADTMFRQICQTNGIIGLQKSKFTFQLPNRSIDFLGCTLWSLVSEKTFATMNDKSAVNDNKEIIKIHINHEKWLRNSLSENENNLDCVVITHHLPSKELNHPRYCFSSINDGFSSNLDHMFDYKINTWIYGHTHESVRIKIKDTYCANNPGGYPGEDKITEFCMEVLEI